MVAIDVCQYRRKPELGGTSTVHLGDKLGCPRAETLSGARVANQSLEALSQCLRRALGRQQAVLLVADEIANAALIAGDYRQAGPERLEDRYAVGLAKRRPNEDVTSLKHCGYLGTGQLAQETHLVACGSAELAANLGCRSHRCRRQAGASLCEGNPQSYRPAGDRSRV